MVASLLAGAQGLAPVMSRDDLALEDMTSEGKLFGQKPQINFAALESFADQLCRILDKSDLPASPESIVLIRVKLILFVARAIVSRMRSLSDHEVALIRTMIKRGMDTTKIQAYFTRPERIINFGRIADIKRGSYAKHVVAAEEEELDYFLEYFVQPSISLSPTSEVLVRSEIVAKIKQDNAKFFIEGGENETLEFKEAFHLRRMAKVLRAMASFANNRGGTILFGVNDNAEVVGLQKDDFFKADIAEITQIVSSALTPFPRFHRDKIIVGKSQLGMLYVHPADRPPIISTKTDDPLKEGTIYFRYPGESKAIKHAELITILEKRDRLERQKFLSTVGRIAEIGPGNAAVLNLNDGIGSGTGGGFVLDKSLLNQIQFIREGQFNEHTGAPTIRIVGDAQLIDPTAATSSKDRKVAISEMDILGDFIRQQKIDSPLDYMVSLLSIQRERLPIFFYIRQAGYTNQAAAEYLTKARTRHIAKRKKLATRILTANSQPLKPGPTVNRFRQSLLSNQPIDFAEEGIAYGYCARALQTIKPTECKNSVLLTSLESAWERIQQDSGVSWFNDFCYAVAHVDTLLFSSTVSTN